MADKVSSDYINIWKSWLQTENVTSALLNLVNKLVAFKEKKREKPMSVNVNMILFIKHKQSSDQGDCTSEIGGDIVWSDRQTRHLRV